MKNPAPARLVCAFTLSVLCAGGIAARAEDTAVKVERIAAFKNGLGHVQAAATLPKGARTVRIEALPAPSHGTFWLEHPESLKVKSLEAEMETVSERGPVQSIAEFLLLNAGKRVRLQADRDVIEGVVLPTVKAPASDGLPSARSSLPATGAVLIQTTEGIVAVNPQALSRAEVVGKEAVTAATTDRQVPVLRLQLAQPSAAESVRVSYLAKGFTWAPSYLIDITDAKMARFSAKASVINELTDLENVTLELVTGFPNVKFGDVTSPMNLKQSLSDFLSAVAGESSPWARGRAARPGVLTQQAVLSNVLAPSQSEGGFALADLSEVEGVSSEDLFFYSIPGFSLRKGGRADTVFLQASLPYRHIYTWSIPDGLDESERRMGETEPAEEVWHCCRMTNTLNMPLTTAPAQFVKEGRIAGQDICAYTPRGAEATIRINKALNLVAERAEIELERKRNAATFHGSSYDLVKVKGELRLRSRMAQGARVEIRKELSGRLLTMEPEGKDTKTAQGLRRVNPRHAVVWEVDVKSGEEKKVVYTYEVYVRS